MDKELSDLVTNLSDSMLNDRTSRMTTVWAIIGASYLVNINNWKLAL